MLNRGFKSSLLQQVIEVEEASWVLPLSLSSLISALNKNSIYSILLYD